VAVGLVLGTCLVFARALGGGFVQIDDPAYVTANPLVRQGLSVSNAWHVVTTDTASMWVPLAMLSHLADVTLWGLDPWGHHLTSVVLHGLTVGMLFLVLSAMTGAPGRSAFAALVFGLHPMRVESVAWIAERKDVLSGLFAVLTVAAHLRWIERPTVARQLVTCACFALGLLAKPMVVTLPVLLLLLDVWPLGRTRVPLRRRIVEKLPLLAVGVLAAWTTLLVVGKTGGMLSLAEVPLGARVENALVSYVRYLGLTFWPAGLAVYYPMPEKWAPAMVGGSLLVIVALGWVAVVTRRRAAYVSVGFAWFAIALLPVIGVLQAGAQAMADRFTYLPAMGLSVCLVWTAAAVADGLPKGPRVATAVGAIVLVALSAATHAQLGHWRSSRALFERTLAVTDRNWFIHAVHGDALRDEGALDEAARHYEEALAIEPGLAKVHGALGAVERARGHAALATAHLVQSIRLDPSNEIAATDLIAALRDRGIAEREAVESVSRLRSGIRAARHDRARPNGERYYVTLARHLVAEHTEAVGRCRAAVERAEPFDLLVTVAPDGSVNDLAAEPPSVLAACVVGSLSGSRLPAPPFAPFHAQLSMNLAG